MRQGGDPTPQRMSPQRWRGFSLETLALVAGLALEMRASFLLVRVFPLALGVRALPPGSAAFVQKLSQPHLVPKLPGDELLIVSPVWRRFAPGKRSR